MSKRKKQIHPQNSFQDLVAQATLARLGGYIDQEIQGLGQALLQRQQQSLQNVLIRLISIEELAMEKYGLTKDDLAARAASIQDRMEGFTDVEAVEVGDRVRLEIKTKTADQTEFQGSSRLLVDNAGTGNTLGKEIEGALVGMKTGETKEIKFGKDQSLTASLYVNRVSRQPKVEAPAAEAAPAEAAATEAPKTEEAPSASANAG